MRILNFGSLNIDYVYAVDHFVTPGETIGSFSMEKHVGGKGLNQSVAFAKAGAEILHAGCIGEDGGFLIDYLKKVGVDVSCVETADVPTGNAVIQVDKTGQNCILLYGGANRAISSDMIDRVLGRMSPGDMIVLQNEINSVDTLIRKAHAAGLTTVFNPSPVSATLPDYPLELVDWFILNEVEGRALTGCSDPDGIIAGMRARFPDARVVLTLGKDGAVWFDAVTEIAVPAGKGKPVDTTAAGDTFTGYFFTAIAGGRDPEEALRLATRASDITVTRKGAAESIPYAWELEP